MLLEKLVAAGIGDRPVIFVTHRLDCILIQNWANPFEVKTTWFVHSKN